MSEDSSNGIWKIINLFYKDKVTKQKVF